MRLRKTVRRAAIAIFVLAAAAGGALIWLKAAPRRTPEGQAALARLDAATLPAFRDAFNGAGGHARILVLLSPT